MGEKREIIPVERIQQKIYLIRGHKVMLDSALAEFYEVTTANLNKAVSRNSNRFPNDFMFQLSIAEFIDLKSQLSSGFSHGGRRARPYAFTEQGVAMLSAVLKSKRAVAVSIQIVRSFIQLREILLSNEVLGRRVRALELQGDEHAQAITEIIRELQKPPAPNTRRIGF